MEASAVQGEAGLRASEAVPVSIRRLPKPPKKRISRGMKKKKGGMWGSGVPGSGRVPDMHKIGARLDRRGRKPPKPDTQLIKYKKKK